MLLFQDLNYTGIRMTVSVDADVLDGIVISEHKSIVIFDNITLLENFSRIQEDPATEVGVNKNQEFKVSILASDYPNFVFDLNTPLDNIQVEFNLSKKLKNQRFDPDLKDVVKCKVTDVYETGFDVLKLIVFKLISLQ